MEELMLFILAVLACYRLVLLFAYEDGPGKVFFNIRLKMGAYDYGDNGMPKTSLGYLAGCPLCQGVYIALILALVLYPVGWNTLLYWFAIAGGQTLLTRVSEEK